MTSLAGRTSGRENPVPFEPQSTTTAARFQTVGDSISSFIDPQTKERVHQATHEQQLQKFFGVPSKPITRDPYDDYSVENLDLPDAYRLVCFVAIQYVKHLFVDFVE